MGRSMARPMRLNVTVDAHCNAPASFEAAPGGMLPDSRKLLIDLDHFRLLSIDGQNVTASARMCTSQPKICKGFPCSTLSAAIEVAPKHALTSL